MISSLSIIALLVMAYMIYRRCDEIIERLEAIETAVEESSTVDEGVTKKKIKKAKNLLELGGDEEDET